MVMSLVAVPSAGCGPAPDPPRCSDTALLEITSPEGLDGELVDAATEHALERLARFESPLRGFAFAGRFQTESQDTIQSSDAALGLLIVDEDWVRLALSDPAEQARLTIDYHPPYRSDAITLGDYGEICPADLPVPTPALPLRLPPTVCEAMQPEENIELSVDVHPVEPDDLEWSDLFFLNELQVGGTPSNDSFQPSGRGYIALDQASYLSNPGDIRVYVDYEAHWRIDRECPTSHTIVTLDILHAERCDISGHTHGRYDSFCITIATIDGRPDWARGF